MKAANEACFVQLLQPPGRMNGNWNRRIPMASQDNTSEAKCSQATC